MCCTSGWGAWAAPEGALRHPSSPGAHTRHRRQGGSDRAGLTRHQTAVSMGAIRLGPYLRVKPQWCFNTLPLRSVALIPMLRFTARRAGRFRRTSL
jgi:hypothetical protein